jgi:hypothetical protein
MPEAMVTFDFEPSFALEADPEFPDDGDWGCPSYGFGRDGRVADDFDSRWGTPAIYRIKTAEGRSWVGMFAAGGLGQLRAAFACPSPTLLCVLADGLAYLVDVESPASGAVIAHDQVGQVVGSTTPPLLLLVRFIDIVAVGPHGIAWKSPRLCVDDLVVRKVTVDAIACTGDNLGGAPEILVDPATGEWLGGSRLPSGWPA